MIYTQVSAGHTHSVLIRADGMAVACGGTEEETAEPLDFNNIPILPLGMQYVGCCAGSCNTVLLRSDGRVIALGDNSYGQLDIR